MVFAESEGDVVKVIEELDQEEKEELVEDLLARGDQYAAGKNFDVANEAYESVFLLDPNNKRASERIDFLKASILKEGRSETRLIGGAYDLEIEARVRVYWKQTQELMTNRRWGQARFTLEKLLLLDPLHKEAEHAHKLLKDAAVEGVEPDLVALRAAR